MRWDRKKGEGGNKRDGFVRRRRWTKKRSICAALCRKSFFHSITCSLRPPHDARWRWWQVASVFRQRERGKRRPLHINCLLARSTFLEGLHPPILGPPNYGGKSSGRKAGNVCGTSSRYRRHNRKGPLNSILKSISPPWSLTPRTYTILLCASVSYRVRREQGGGDGGDPPPSLGRFSQDA